MITPTVGRVVWFYPHGSDLKAPPLAAIITAVWTDTRVNLCVLSPEGVPWPSPPTSVLLVQEENQRPESGRCFCTWMPYQLGQAAKAESVSGDVNSLAFGDRLRIITDLLRGINVTLLDDIYAAARAVLEAPETKAKIEAGLLLADLIAQSTKQTDIDDKFVATVKTILKGPLLDLVAGIIDRWRAQQAAGVASAASFESLTVDEEAKFVAAGVDPATVLMILRFLWDLWQSRK